MNDMFVQSLSYQWWWRFSWKVISNSRNPTDCDLQGFSFHGIFQARILEWVAIVFSELTHLENLKNEEMSSSCEGRIEGSFADTLGSAWYPWHLA